MKHWDIALDVDTVYRTRVEANTEEEARDIAEQEAYEDTWSTAHIWGGFWVDDRTRLYANAKGNGTGLTTRGGNMTEQEELNLFMINASGDHLTEQLPPNFDEMEEDKLMEFIQEHLWQPFEDWYDMPEQVYEFIQNSAYSTMRFMRENNLMKEEMK